ncbi:MAG: cupin domain-containing protein [Rhodothermales bacterium]
MLPETQARYLVAQMDDLAPQKCPCGFTRRAFVPPENDVASIHLVDITTDSRTHYHKHMTEIYLVREGEGHIELDGERIPVRPNTSVLIRPGCRHRAVGALKVAVIAIPAFDEADEWFD